MGFGLHPKWLGNGTREEFLLPLKAAGLTALEFTLHPGTDEWESMRALAEECARVGYPCHFHAPYQSPFTLFGFASNQRDAIQKMYTPALELVERLAEENHFTPSLVIHGATADAPRTELRRDTEEFLTWVLSVTRHARLMLENLPPKSGLTRTGESREEVLDIVQQFNHPRLAICWDLGHDFLLGYTELPDTDFLRAVHHVHIHDVNVAGEDHFPLVFGNVPWQADLHALANCEFDGAVIMEINGYRARAVERLYERMAASFVMMREVVDGNAN